MAQRRQGFERAQALRPQLRQPLHTVLDLLGIETASEDMRLKSEMLTPFGAAPPAPAHSPGPAVEAMPFQEANREICQSVGV